MLFPFFYFYKNFFHFSTNKRSPGSTPGATQLALVLKDLRLSHSSRISKRLRPSHPSRLYSFKFRLNEIAYPLTLKDSVISFFLVYGYIFSLRNGISLADLADLAPSLPDEEKVQPRNRKNPISVIRRDISDMKKDIQDIKEGLLKTEKMNQEISTIGAACFISGLVIGVLIRWLLSPK